MLLRLVLIEKKTADKYDQHVTPAVLENAENPVIAEVVPPPILIDRESPGVPFKRKPFFPSVIEFL